MMGSLHWALRKFSATIINDVLPEVLLFTSNAAMVVLVSEKTDVNLGISNRLLIVLGLVLGLVISFRTSSAYERYQEGRKMWTNLSIMSRNMAQMIWIHVPNDRPNQSVLESIIEKKTMINLIHAYAVSVKVLVEVCLSFYCIDICFLFLFFLFFQHLLRQEQGVYYEDLYPLVAFLPRYATDNAKETEGNPADRLPLWQVYDESNQHVPVSQEITGTQPGNYRSREGNSSHCSITSDTKQTLQPPTLLPITPHPEGGLPKPVTSSGHPLKPARNPPPFSVFNYIPVLGLIRWLIRKLLRLEIPDEERKKRKRIRRKQGQIGVESAISLEIFLVLSNYSAWLMKSGLVQPAIATGMTTSLASLEGTVLNLERICHTPLPFAYQVHLRMSLWLYLIFLPFQIYPAFGFVTIPATAFVTFLLLGFLKIGQEIENPFNYNENDLDLDFFCLLIQRDLHQITANVHSDPSKFIFTKWNQPFAPVDLRSAEELTRFIDQPYRSVDSDAVEPGINSIRRTLVNGWNTVDELSRVNDER